MSKKLKKLLNMIIEKTLDTEFNWCYDHTYNKVNLDFDDIDLSISKIKTPQNEHEYSLEIKRIRTTIFLKRLTYKRSEDKSIYILVKHIHKHIYKKYYSLDMVINVLSKNYYDGKIAIKMSKHRKKDKFVDLPF